MSHSTKSVLHGVLMTLVAIGCGRDARMKPSLGFMKDEQTAGNSSFWILLLLVFEKCSSSIIYEVSVHVCKHSVHFLGSKRGP